MEQNEMTYAQAIAELEEIVERMQDDNCDIDNLARYTTRSLELLRFCKQRLNTVDAELKKSLAALTDE